MESLATLIILTIVYGLVILSLFTERQFLVIYRYLRKHSFHALANVSLAVPVAGSFLGGFLLANLMVEFFRV